MDCKDACIRTDRLTSHGTRLLDIVWTLRSRAHLPVDLFARYATVFFYVCVPIANTPLNCYVCASLCG